MTAMAGRISDYGNNFDFRSMLESKLNAKKSELGETELNIKRIGGSRLGPSTHRGVEGGGERLSSFKDRLGPVVTTRGGRSSHQNLDRRTSINSRLGPRVSNSDDPINDDNDESNVTGESNGYGGEVTGKGSVMSRIVVEQKSREDALAEQKQDKKENQRNKRMFGSILGTLQKFRADETKDKDREQKRRKIETKIDQKTEKERAEAIKQKQELFEDKKKKEMEIKVLQVQMKRAEEFEVWERCKRKEQKYIRTKNCTTKIYYLPKNHNDSTLTALENTMDEIDEEIRVAREVFEEELQKISARAEQNPTASLEDLEGDDNSGDENETDRATKSIVSTIRKPVEDKVVSSKEIASKERHISQTKSRAEDLNGSAEYNGKNMEKETKINHDRPKVKGDYDKNNDIAQANILSDSLVISEDKSVNENLEIIDTPTNKSKETMRANNDNSVMKSSPQTVVNERENSNNSQVMKSLESNGHQENHSRIKRKSGEISRSLSPNANERKKHKSGTLKENTKNPKDLSHEKNDRSLKKKIKDSDTTDQSNKRPKQRKKRKDSSSDSSSSSSSSDDQSDSDKNSTNSSSYSDSSDVSSSDSDAKKKSKKLSHKKSRNKKAMKEKTKDKYSSNNRKRDDKGSRNTEKRKSYSKKHSDSSD